MAGVRRRAARYESGDGWQLPADGRARKQSRKFGFKEISIIIVTLGLCYVGWNKFNEYLQVRKVYSPLKEAKVAVDNNKNRFWGTYRPQVYFGMKTRNPQSLVTGMMWMEQYIPYNTGQLPLRHSCDQGDKLPRYGWIAHDGTNFGIQDITERRYNLRTEFVKRSGGSHGGEWTWRITGRGNPDNTAISLFFYAATDHQGTVKPITEEYKDGKRMVSIDGFTDELGEFTIEFPIEHNDPKRRFHHTVVKVDGLDKIKEGVLRKLQRKEVKRFGAGDRKFTHYSLFENDNIGNSDNPTSTVVVYQVTLETPFVVEVLFKSGSCQQKRVELSGDTFQQELMTWNMRFDQRFESRFPLKMKGYDNEHVMFAKSAFSNMIGGMGYFYGHSFIRSQHHEQPIAYWDAPLYTAVPSRSFFPRGFLWDEGFHQILLNKWDRSISQEAIGSWLDLMNMEGWIPREQILDNEARSKVPAEFIVQHNKNANPPTLYLSILSIMEGMHTHSINQTRDYEFLKRAYPRLRAWYDWFNTTQVGPVSGSYRWHGRKMDSNDELNPKTLTSGLDDFPRASHPSDDERHLDLRCWMALASDAMSKIAKLIGEDATKYEAASKYLSDNKLLDDLHWSNKLQRYADFGYHSNKLSLVRKTFQATQPGQPPTSRVVRIEKEAPKASFVNAFGYVNLFPFLLKIINPKSPKLEIILNQLKSRDLLWTDYGLRSLSKSDPLYMKRNTEHDPPYWRGQIWINMNFLAIRALKYYSDILPETSSVKELATNLYKELRENVIKNIVEQYKVTGYIWENYSDSNGSGNGCHPFTGWSSLVALIMSEQY